MKTKTVALLLSMFVLIGCGDAGSTLLSDSSSGVTTEASVPTSLRSGTEISFNPEIVFTGELLPGSSANATYTNTSGSGSLPAGDNDNISVSFEIISTGVKLSFNHGGKAVELMLSNFLDMGNTGYIDEFTVEAKVDGVTQDKQSGRFSGNVKPRNTSISKPIDTNRAPTEAEFQKYIVGKAFYHEETSPEPGDDAGYMIFNADGTVDYFDLDDDGPNPDEINAVEIWTYNYNGGNPTLTLREDWTSKFNGKKNYWVVTVDLDFTNFFEGTYKDIYEAEDGVVDSTIDEGIWKIFNSISTQ